MMVSPTKATNRVSGYKREKDVRSQTLKVGEIISRLCKSFKKLF